VEKNQSQFDLRQAIPEVNDMFSKNGSHTASTKVLGNLLWVSSRGPETQDKKSLLSTRANPNTN